MHRCAILQIQQQKRIYPGVPRQFLEPSALRRGILRDPVLHRCMLPKSTARRDLSMRRCGN